MPQQRSTKVGGGGCSQKIRSPETQLATSDEPCYEIVMLTIISACYGAAWEEPKNPSPRASVFIATRRSWFTIDMLNKEITIFVV